LASGTIKNIIFDLGGVLVDIDPDRTAKAFARLSETNAVDIMELHKSQNFFVDYEKGLIDDVTFRNHIRQFLDKDIPDIHIDNAWTAMLVEFPPQKIELLEIARKNYRTFLLSNTNNIHRIKFEKCFIDTAHSDFYDYFERVYYSFEMHMRKPDKEIFVKVLEENKLIPRETLMIDDHLPNVRMASNLGIQTRHVKINQENIEIESYGRE